MIAISVHGYATRVMETSEFIFRLLVGLLVFSYAILSLYLEEVSMAKKLAKVKSFSKTSSDQDSKFLQSSSVPSQIRCNFLLSQP